MSKRGVFGMKSTPMDMPSMAKIVRPKEVTIREAKTGGYIIHTEPGKGEDGYSRDEHVKETLSAAIEFAEKHLSGEKPEKKEGAD